MSGVTKSNRRVIGVDPGLARLGWAVVEFHAGTPALIGCGCLETAAAVPLPKRLQTLHQRLSSVIAEYRPSRLAIEKLFFTKNVATGMVVGQARGVALLAAAEASLPVEEYTPTSVKLAITGDGRADKRQMGHMIQILLKLRRLPKHDDTTDAVAIALCASTVKMVH